MKKYFHFMVFSCHLVLAENHGVTEYQVVAIQMLILHATVSCVVRPSVVRLSAPDNFGEAAVVRQVWPMWSEVILSHYFMWLQVPCA